MDIIKDIITLISDCPGWSIKINDRPIWVSVYTKKRGSATRDDGSLEKAKKEGRPIQTTHCNFKGTTCWSTVDGYLIHLIKEKQLRWIIELDPKKKLVRASSSLPTGQFMPGENRYYTKQPLKYIKGCLKNQSHDAIQQRIRKNIECIRAELQDIEEALGLIHDNINKVKAICGDKFNAVRPYLNRDFEKSHIKELEEMAQERRNKIAKAQEEINRTMAMRGK